MTAMTCLGMVFVEYRLFKMRDVTREAMRGEDCDGRSGTGPVGWKEANRNLTKKKRQRQTDREG